MGSKAKVLSTRLGFRGNAFQVTVDHVMEPGGVKARREVVRHGGSVVVLPRLASGKVLLVRQFRYPARESLWELVAGGIEPGETPAKAAARELLEETGYRARFFPSPGFLTEEMHLIEAAGLAKGQTEPEEDERIISRAFTQAELKKIVRNQKIKDGKTLVGLLWLFQRWTAR